MKLVLNDGTAIELAMGNNQNQFVVAYQSEEELAAIELLLTDENLSNAHYEINGTITDTLHNKVLSGSNRNLITKKVTYYLADSNVAEISELKATIEQLESEKQELQEKTQELETILISITTVM